MEAKPEPLDPTPLQLATGNPAELCNQIIRRIRELKREAELLELTSLGVLCLRDPSESLRDELAAWHLLADAGGCADRPPIPAEALTRWRMVHQLDLLRCAIRQHRRQPAQRGRRKRDSRTDSQRAWSFMRRNPEATLTELMRFLGCSRGVAMHNPRGESALSRSVAARRLSLNG